MPLNLHHWTKDDLDYMNIKYEMILRNGVQEIRVIKWRLDDRTHAMCLHEMMEYINNHEP